MGFRENYPYTFKRLKDDELRHEIRSLRVGLPDSLAPILERNHAAVARKLDSVREGQVDAALFVVEGQRRAAQSVINELAHLEREFGRQITDLTKSVETTGAQISDAVERAARYLGAELSRISYQLSLQTAIGQETLRVLKDSLGNESRQYFEQGMAAFLQDEIEIARDRFQRALEANSINPVAYFLLGHIAIEDDDPDAALRFFDLARKFAPDKKQAAICWYELANCHRALGALDEARSCLDSALVANETAWLRYEHAKICALQGRAEDCGESLEMCFRRDWTFWGLSVCEPGFDPVQAAATGARERTKQGLHERLQSKLVGIQALTKRLGNLPTGDPAPITSAAAVQALQTRYDSDNLYDYVKAIEMAQPITRSLLEAAERGLAKRVKEAQGRFDSLARQRELADRQTKEEMGKARSEHDKVLAADDKRIEDSYDDVFPWTNRILFGALALFLIVGLWDAWTSAKDGTGHKILETVLLLIICAIAGFILFLLSIGLSSLGGLILASYRKHRKWRSQQDWLLADRQRTLDQRRKSTDEEFARQLREVEAEVNALKSDHVVVERELKACGQ